MKQRDGDVQRRLISMEPVSILGHDIYLHMTYIGAIDTMSYHDLSTLYFHSPDTWFSCIRVREMLDYVSFGIFVCGGHASYII